MISGFRRWYGVTSQMLIGAAKKYGRDRTSRMAAAIAYRTVFALAPLLIVAVSVVGAVLGSSVEAQQEIIRTVENIAGPEMAQFVQDFLSSALSSADTAAIVGFALLFWLASSLFLELQNDLNDIFEVPLERHSGIIATIRERGIGFLWTIGLGLSVLLVMLVNTVWGLIEGIFPAELEGLYDVVAAVGPAVSLVLLPLMFALIFQTMTAASLRWRAVWLGAVFTAFVFVAAGWGIGVYFRVWGQPTALGFATSLVVVLFLAYVLSSVFLFGAGVTKVYTDHLDELERPVESGPPPPPGVVVAAAPTAVPKSALLAFLGGLLIGWRRSRR